MSKQLKIVEVIWFDAQSSLESMTIEDINQHFKPLETRSVGYLMKETDEYIILAFADFGNGLYKHWQVIPAGMIKSRKVIKK